MLRMIGDEVLVHFRGHENPHRNRLKSGERLVVSRVADPVAGMQVTLQSTLDSVPNAEDKPSTSALAGFPSPGKQQARLAMSDSTGRVDPRE